MGYHLLKRLDAPSAESRDHKLKRGMNSARYPPIADDGVIANLQTVALISTDGTVDWYCSPRLDCRACSRRCLTPSAPATLRSHGIPGRRPALTGPTRRSGLGGVVQPLARREQQASYKQNIKPKPATAPPAVATVFGLGLARFADLHVAKTRGSLRVG